jgi:hypothetical protein
MESSWQGSMDDDSHCWTASCVFYIPLADGGQQGSANQLEILAK